MAKTTGALFSIEASGQFAKTIVFDKRGIARVYKIPANPQTPAQGNQRQRMANVQRAIGRIGYIDLPAVGQSWLDSYKSKIPQAYRWQATLLGEATKGVDYTASDTAWDALGGSPQALWNTAATTAGITATEIDYAAETAQTNGEAMFHLARAVFYTGTLQAGYAGTTAIPGAANATQWAENLFGV